MDLGLLLLLQIQILLVFGDQHPKNVVPERCKFLLEESQVYERRCHGSYPMVAFTKYRDTLIKVGEPFSMYMPPSLESVLVLQKHSPLHSCHSLQFKDSNSFYCLDDSQNETIVVDQANIFCFPFHIQLPDDLMNECLIENDAKKDRHYLDEVVSSRQGIVHYTFGVSGGQTLRIPALLPLLLLPGLSRKF